MFLYIKLAAANQYEPFLLRICEKHVSSSFSLTKSFKNTGER